jgi:ATP phosphoribosyltransferase
VVSRRTCRSVESGAADLGITGSDVLRKAKPTSWNRSNSDSVPAVSWWRLRLPRPGRLWRVGKPPGLPQISATGPGPLRRPRPAVDIVAVSGSVEVAPLLNSGPLIVDLVDTGNTLRANGLVERESILTIGAVLVANRAQPEAQAGCACGVDGPA